MAAWHEPSDCLTQADVARSMRLVLYDGLTTQTMGTLTSGVFLTAFAIHLGASNLLIGLLAAIPFLGQLMQVPAILLVERMRRRRLLVVVTSLIARLMLLMIALGAFLPDAAALTLLVLGLCAYALTGSVAGCAWTSWMRDLLPPSRLGWFFSRRLFGMTLLGAVVGYAAGFAIDAWTEAFAGREAGIYAILFAVGALFGLIGVLLLSRTVEPRMPPPEEHVVPWRLLAKPFGDHNFRRLMLFLGTWSFAVNLAAPFFTVYMLDRLRLPMAQVIPLTILGQVVNMLCLGVWGRVADRTSNKAVLSVCGPLYLVCFLGWTFTTFPERHAYTMHLLYVLHGLMGLAMAGVTLAIGNIALKLSPQGRATPYLAMSGMISSLAAGLAPILGGASIDLFDQRRLSIQVEYAGPTDNVVLHALSFNSWDFFFALAALIGLYSMYRLTLLQEEGSDDSRGLTRLFLIETRRGLHHVATLARLRCPTGSPVAEQLRAQERGKPQDRA